MNEPNANAPAIRVENPSLEQIDAMLEAEISAQETDIAEGEGEGSGDGDKGEGKEEPPKKEAAGETSKKDETKEKAKEGEDEGKEKPVEEGKALRSIQTREKKLVERQQLFSKERQEFEAQKATFSRDVQAYFAERDLAKNDPLAYLQKVHGISEEALARRILNNGKPGPEEEQDQFKKSIEERLQRVEQRERDLERREQEQGAQARREQAGKAFADYVTTSGEYPLIAARYDEQEIAEEGFKLWEYAFRTTATFDAAGRMVKPGVSYTDDEIAAALEKREQKREARARGQGSGENKTDKVESKKTGTASKGTNADDSKPVPTLSGKNAAQGNSNVEDFDPLMVSEEEIDRLAVKAAREARGGKK